MTRRIKDVGYRLVPEKKGKELGHCLIAKKNTCCVLYSGIECAEIPAETTTRTFTP